MNNSDYTDEEAQALNQPPFSAGDGVHRSHCCPCGCKYGADDCPVVSGRLGGVLCDDCSDYDAATHLKQMKTPAPLTTGEIVEICEQAMRELGQDASQMTYLRRAFDLALERRPLPQLPEWTSVRERGATAKDGDVEGEVMWLTKKGNVFTGDWSEAFSGEVWWMPCAAIAALPKRPVPEPPPKDRRGYAEIADSDAFQAAIATSQSDLGRKLTEDELEMFAYGWKHGRHGI